MLVHFLMKRFDVGDDARLYEKTKYNLLSGMLTQSRIRDQIPIDETIRLVLAGNADEIGKNLA